jgi:hypothetical protein
LRKLLLQAFLRILGKKFFMGKGKTVIAAVGQKDPIGGVDLADAFRLSAAGIRMKAFDQIPVPGLDIP